jgi:thiaminase
MSLLMLAYLHQITVVTLMLDLTAAKFAKQLAAKQLPFDSFDSWATQNSSYLSAAFLLLCRLRHRCAGHSSAP